MPERVRAATSEYRKAEDTVALWLEERCHVAKEDHAFRCKSSELYRNFCDWSESFGEKPISHRAWGDAMAEEEFVKKTSNGVWYLGIALKDREEE